MDKLNFLTAGIPLCAADYESAFDTYKKLNLDGIELEFVHGVRISDKSKEIIKNKKNDYVITSHGPYYINLNAKEEDKVKASIERIAQTARVAHSLGGYSVTYHAGFYLGQDKDKVFDKILEGHSEITNILKNENINIWIRPETTGKRSQWGDLEEIVKLSKQFDNVLPCVDFAHLHARCGGNFNTFEQFCSVFDLIGNELGDVAIDNFHAHIAGIAYSDKGEKHHLILEESDFNYKDLLKAFKKFNVKGAIICESPNIEQDCMLLKKHWQNIN